jgi:hypothetical protein
MPSDLPGSTVGVTLRQILDLLLEKLDPARPLATIGTALGREFDAQSRPKLALLGQRHSSDVKENVFAAGSADEAETRAAKKL